MELLVVVVAFGFGLWLPKTALLVGVVLAPLPMVGVLGFVYWKRRRVAVAGAAMFCEGVASELRSGAPLGKALAAAAVSVEEPSLGVLEPDTPPMEAAQLVAEAFPEVGAELSSTIAAAFRGGSQSADLFDEIGSLAIAQSEVSREVRIASAPARATTLVFIGAPVFYLILQMRSDRLVRLLAHPEQRVVALIGLALFGVGLGTAGLLAWRAR